MLSFKKQRFKTDPSYYEPSILKTWIFEKLYFETHIPIGRTEIIVTILESCPRLGFKLLRFFILT